MKNLFLCSLKMPANFESEDISGEAVMVPRRAILCWIFVLLSPFALAQEPPLSGVEDQRTNAAVAERDRSDSDASRHRPTESAKSPGPGVLELLPPDSVTEHNLSVGDQKIAYTATAGTLNLLGQNGERSAGIFYTAYVVAKGPTGARPLTFVFNGGPGAASAFLHLGLVGPKVLNFGPDGRDGANAKLVDNPDSWLRFTDLVLIDPVGTGWSRPAKADGASNFYGVRQDAQAIAKAIALYVSHNGRSSSPKYLFGESYGGFRAVKVAQVLRRDQGIVMSGIIMLSPLLEGSLTFDGSQFALGAALQLPSMAATELEHRKAFSKEAIEEIERFALTDYLTILAGPSPTEEAAQSFYAHVAKLTGLAVDVVRRTRGFVRKSYIKHIREQGQAIVSAYDASFGAPDPFPESDSDESPDPILEGFVRAYGGAFASYARDELGFKTEMTYTLLATDVNEKWDWGKNPGGAGSRASASGDIRELLALVPSFRFIIAQGYSDLVTPYGIAKYVIGHLPPELASSRVQLKLYRGGHMLYTSPASRSEFTEDAKAFLALRSDKLP